MKSENPFSVTTPESMSAEDVVRFMVESSPTRQIQSVGHHFIHGHRGSGKSMAFRFLSPDCQKLYRNACLHELDYFAIYCPVKSTDLDLHEFSRLENSAAGDILAEHILVTYVMIKAILCLKNHCSNEFKNKKHLKELKEFLKRYVVTEKVLLFDASSRSLLENAKTPIEALNSSINTLDLIHAQTIEYLRRCAFNKESLPYGGAVFGFRDFLHPAMQGLLELSPMPKGCVFILIDDADNLNLQQTKVLNSWISYRITKQISIKASTQLRYKTYLTSTNKRISAPHDYKEIDAFSIFTGAGKDSYPKWVKSIVSKRLESCGIKSTPDAFFPVDRKQEDAIKRLQNKFKDEWPQSGKGYRAGDDAYRYARPEYIRQLGGNKKGTHNYSYSGFDQLVHISSGIIRHFLDAASDMYAEEFERISLENPKLKNISLDFISPGTQDRVVRSLADYLMGEEFDKLLLDSNSNPMVDEYEIRKREIEALKNLIEYLGGIFYSALVSQGRSERRVFTIALSDKPSDIVSKILDVAVENGYLYKDYLGTKEGFSRTMRFVLTRRVAPYFKLDPMGFAGYLFVTNSQLEMAIKNPAQAVKNFKINRLKESSSALQRLPLGEEEQ